jgi:hypothetical protein
MVVRWNFTRTVGLSHTSLSVQEVKYDLVKLEIPPGVIIEEDMLDAVGILRYAYHELTYMTKFLELALDKYRNVRLTLDSK